MKFLNDLSVPVAGENDVLVKPTACGMNYTDINTHLLVLKSS